VSVLDDEVVWDVGDEVVEGGVGWGLGVVCLIDGR
jgi:hypothetical protein